MNKQAPSKDAQGIARHASVYAIGNVVRQLAGFLMLPVYTQYLSPADYGAVGLLALAMAVLEPFFGARLTQAIPKFYFLEQNEVARRAVITSALTLTAGVSAITTVMIWIFSGPASQLLFGTGEYALATALFGLNMLTQPVEYSGMTFIRMQQRSVLFLWISLAKLAAQIALNLLLVVHMNLGVVGVVLSGVIASTVFGAGLTAYTFFYNRPRLDLGILWKMLAFSWPLWFAGLAGLYTGSASRLYLRIFGSLDSIGIIELGARFAGIISLLIWAPFSQHWDTVSYKLYAEGKAERTFQTAFLVVSTLLLVVGLGVSVFSKPAIELMSAPSFHSASATVPLLALALIFNSLIGLFSFGFLVTDNTRMVSVSQYFMAVIITGLFLALIPPFKEVGAALAQCLASAVTFLFVHRMSRRHFDPGVRLKGFWLGIFAVATAYACSNVLIETDDMLTDLCVKIAIYTFTSAFLLGLCMRQLRRQDPDAYGLLIAAWQRGSSALRARRSGRA